MHSNDRLDATGEKSSGEIYLLNVTLKCGTAKDK